VTGGVDREILDLFSDHLRAYARETLLVQNGIRVTNQETLDIYDGQFLSLEQKNMNSSRGLFVSPLTSLPNPDLRSTGTYDRRTPEYSGHLRDTNFASRDRTRSGTVGTTKRFSRLV